MGKLALLIWLLSTIITSAEINEKILEDVDNGLEENFTNFPRKISRLNDEQIWILSFNDEFEINVLRSPNRAEIKAFKKIMAPAIKSDIKNKKEDNKSKQQHSTKKHFIDKSNKHKAIIQKNKSSKIEYDTTSSDLKLDLKRIINKFLFSTGLNEPTQHLSTNNSKPPNLKLYFKGPYCSIILESGRSKNQYFTDADSESLPKWFYEEHNNIEHDDKGDFVVIPADLKTEFYEQFLNLLKKCLGYTI